MTARPGCPRPALRSGRERMRDAAYADWQWAVARRKDLLRNRKHHLHEIATRHFMSEATSRAVRGAQQAMVSGNIAGAVAGGAA